MHMDNQACWHKEPNLQRPFSGQVTSQTKPVQNCFGSNCTMYVQCTIYNVQGANYNVKGTGNKEQEEQGTWYRYKIQSTGTRYKVQGTR